MFCVKCHNGIEDCECPDLQERLDAAVAGGGFAYRRCKICKQHYLRCKCENPEWEILGGK